MAKLPSPDDIAQPTVRVSPNAHQVPVATQTPLEDTEIQAGQRFSSAGKEMQSEFDKEMERVNRVRAEDAFSQLRNAQIDLTSGEDGFTHKKGEVAVKGQLIKDYSTRFSTAATKIMEGLDNEDQKFLFKKQMDVAQAQYTHQLLEHNYKQYDVYREQTYKGQLASEQNIASTQWDNPFSVEGAAARVRNAVKEFGSQSGWPKEMIDATIAEQVSHINAAVIGQALASKDYVYAKGWFDSHRSEIDTATAKTFEHQIGEANQKQVADGFNNAFIAYRNNPKGLDALSKAVAQDETLDDTRKTALVGRIESRSEVLANRAERAAMRQERIIEKGINQINAITLAGYDVTAEQMLPLINASKGTALEGQVKQMVAVANYTSKFRQAAPREQEAMISKLEVQARQDPTKFDVSMIGKLKTIQENQRKAVKDDPITFAVRQGFVDSDNPAAAPLDLSKPENLGSALAARTSLARDVSLKYNAPLKPLTTEEVATLSSSLKKAPTEQKRDYFAKLATVSDVDTYKAIMGQLAPDDPVTAIGGAYAGKGYQQTDAGYKPEAGKARVVADLIFKGQDILNPVKTEDGKPSHGKLLPMPAEKDMTRVFDNTVRNAYAGMPKARSDHYQAARAIYAALSSEAGDSDTSIMDSSRWEKSIKLATGGVERWNGASIVMPWGQTRSSFKDGLYARIDQLAGSGDLDPTATPSRLKEMPLRAVGDGRYVFTSGDNVLVGKSGKPIIIDFNTPVVPQSALVKAIPK